MESLTDVYLSPLPADSPYVRPFRFNYTQNGAKKSWDLLRVHDSVAIVVFNVSRRVLVFVKQFRPAVYYNSIPAADRADGRIDTAKYPAALGLTLEMCAGIVDKQLSNAEIAREEVLEECGYRLQPQDLQRVASYRSGVGRQGSVQTLYYCEVTDDMRVQTGGGVDDELIEVVELPLAAAERLLPGAEGARPGDAPQPSPPSGLFALSWFFAHKADKWRQPPRPSV